jgi:hypothetical protein
MYFLACLVSGIALCSYFTVTCLVWNDKRTAHVNPKISYSQLSCVALRIIERSPS